MVENHTIRRLCLSIGLLVSLLLLNTSAWSAKPDLQLQFLDIGPTVPYPPLTDRPTNFYALVVNAGTHTVKSPFTVSVELDGKVVRTWQFPIKNEIKDYKPQAESAIPPGKARLFQYVATLKQGRHTVRWHVDTATRTEIRATVEAQPPPDLVVTIWPTGDKVLAYHETEWNIEVKNIGGGKAFGPFVTLFNSFPTGGPIAQLEFPEGQSLAKDEAYLFKVNQRYDSLDPVTVSARVDYRGDVTEAMPFGDDNNSFEKKYDPRSVDLEVSALELKPAQVTAAELSFRINKGNMDAAKSFNVGILITDAASGAIELIDAVEAEPLPAGQSEQLTKTIHLSQPGSYRVQVIADAAMIGPNPNVFGRQYAEPDVANNSKEEQVAVMPAAGAVPAGQQSEESVCKSGQGVVKMYRIASNCSAGSIQPYTGFIPPTKQASLKRVANTTRQWKLKIVDSFNLKGTGSAAQCEKYGGLCWDRIPLAFLMPGESWVNSALQSLDDGMTINACLEPLSNAPFPLAVEIEYGYECLP
jgi:hypothetical protein